MGRKGAPTELHRLTNLEPGVERYLVDDAELCALSRANDERWWDFVAIYHSHPVSVAFHSETDRELAFWEDAVNVICSLGPPDAPVLRGFQIVADAVTELELVEGAEYEVGSRGRVSAPILDRSLPTQVRAARFVAP